MKIEIKTIDEQRGILQITTLDERWYQIGDIFLPSVTWIAGYYPKGIGFYKWLANTGWDEAEAIKKAAGEKGSKVHQATELIDKGQSIKIDELFFNSYTKEDEELTPDEINCIATFCKWLDESKAQLICNEFVVIGDGYAGTLDRIYRIDGAIWIVDLKTSKDIWEEHKLQLSAYSHANIDYSILGIKKEEWDKRKLGILQLGYERNKNNFKFTEVEDKFELFKMAQAIWKNENPDSKPKQKDYPLILEAKIRKE